MLMAHLTGNHLDGLCYKLIDWFYVIKAIDIKWIKIKEKFRMILIANLYYSKLLKTPEQHQLMSSR